ncbi:DNA polymerase nu isoform X1 [Misgurnus anguillicaudatus]|uniref:DNA polymerase nu isoform X1 n=2 Tax=Misgurnus anguillicaudatus TaxID=75329 RepID=UPI003CCF51D9
MDSYLRSSLNAAPLSAAGQIVLAALHLQYPQRCDRSRAIAYGIGFRMFQAINNRNQELFRRENKSCSTDTCSQTYRPDSSQPNPIIERQNQDFCTPSQEPKELDLSELAPRKSTHIELRGVLCNEKIADDITKPSTQSVEPVAQGEILPACGSISKEIPQVKSPVTEPNSLTFSKGWIEPQSLAEKIPVGYNLLEAHPVKKSSCGWPTLPTNICDINTTSREKGTCNVKTADTQGRDEKRELFRNNQSYSEENDFVNEGLIEKANVDSFCEIISKEAKCDHQAVLVQTQPSLLSNAEKSKLHSLETSLCLQNNANCELSAPLESFSYVQRCGNITALECDQDTFVKSNESVSDLLRLKEDCGSDRREITTGTTNFPQLEGSVFQMNVGDGISEMESASPTVTEGMQHCTPSLLQSGKVNPSLKHSLKCEPPHRRPSQEAPKITSSSENLILTATSTSSKVQQATVKKGSKRLLKQPKAPQLDIKRPRHPFRPQIESSQELNESNHSEASKPSEPSHTESIISLPSKTDKKEEMTTSTCKGTFSFVSDPRVCDTGRLSQEEQKWMLEEAGRAKALVVTMVYQDGTIQLDPEQRSCPAVCGLLVLLKMDLDSEGLEDRPQERVLYLRLEQKPAWAQQDLKHKQDAFTREMVLQMVCGTKPFVCFKAKDLFRTALKHFSRDLSWEQVLVCEVMDPQIAAWLLDPADSASCFQTLLSKHYTCPVTRISMQPVFGHAKVTQVISNLSLLHNLMLELHNKLQTQGLWQLYSGIEQKMIPVLAAMESYKMHVDKEALKRTSEMLGSKLKQLEQEAHQAAGQQFLVSSSAQLRLILFEKLRLHERCENKKLPKTVKQQQSTSETALLQLQNLHSLPKIILEYRQIHKIKTAFVDGILSCTNKTFISSTWNQTSTVSGRLSAKHPNFQALPKQPLQILKKQYVHGKDSEVVTVHPRAMFIPREGWTFLSADFCQVELRLLAHLSSDPQLLSIFQKPEADAFTMLAAQWKGVSEDRVSLEQAKRIVYSVIYGAGKERLSGILGVNAEEASRFQDTFIQTYREVQAFVQHTIQFCHKNGFVKSIMGRRRSLPHIRSADWSLRNQAERQAVNFVLQGSAADLAKMAMIKICSQVSFTAHTARLVAQIHDELLFEVESSQVHEFAVLVKKTMESLQHIESLGVSLSVPLKVSLSTGQSWGSMCEMNPSCTTSASSP